MLYVALKRRFNPKLHNNGKLFLSQRMASAELRSHHNQIARWYRELQHYGFIVLSKPAYLGVEGKGQAPRWRLTELGYMRDPPTRDYTRWDGAPFVDQKNPVREITHGVWQETRTLACMKSTRQNPPPCRYSRTKRTTLSVMGNRHRTMLPLPLIVFLKLTVRLDSQTGRGATWHEPARIHYPRSLAVIRRRCVDRSGVARAGPSA